MSAHQIGQVAVAAFERFEVVERIAVAEEGREQHAAIDAGFVERAQDVVGAFAAGAVQVGVDDHLLLGCPSVVLS